MGREVRLRAGNGRTHRCSSMLSSFSCVSGFGMLIAFPPLAQAFTGHKHTRPDVPLSWESCPDSVGISLQFMTAEAVASESPGLPVAVQGGNNCSTLLCNRHALAARRSCASWRRLNGPRATSWSIKRLVVDTERPRSSAVYLM